MIKVVGVRFRNSGKVYYFDPKDFEIRSGAHVIVETVRGIEHAAVVGGVFEVPDDKVTQPLKPVIRVASPEDDERAQRNHEKEREALAICREKVRKHGLEMKLIDAEYTFDNNKILFYFTADGRVDFRELVKDLAAVFRTRIELRQIGVRDETKILGGIGICGRPLCCHTWLPDFIPVSIRMAKEQNLSLNPAKISGVCGRLMCCLKNEESTYQYLNGRLPRNGDMVTTPSGRVGEVSSVNVLRQTVKVLVDVDDEKELQEYHVEELSFQSRKRKDKKDPKDQKDSGTAEEIFRSADKEAAEETGGFIPEETENPEESFFEDRKTAAEGGAESPADKPEKRRRSRRRRKGNDPSGNDKKKQRGEGDQDAR